MEQELTCGNADCKIAKNGSCLQGHDPVESCPHFGIPIKNDDEHIKENSNVEEELAEEPKLQLSSGQHLTQAGVDTFLLQRTARLVAIVGDTSCGKSTLLCSIYDRFQRNTFAERSFVASNTLTGFEQLAHLSRAASGALTPDTKRTYISEGLQYYHLASAPILKPVDRIDLFLADRAGETYRSGMDRPEELANLTELNLARIIVVLIDGARLSNTEEKHEVLDSGRRIVRAMIDGDALNENQHLQIVLTKRDEVERSGIAKKLIAELQELTKRLKRDFGSKLASITFFETAARDPDSVYEPAHGCGDLLSSWVDATDPLPYTVPQSEISLTHFDRLARNCQFGVEK